MDTTKTHQEVSSKGKISVAHSSDHAMHEHKETFITKYIFSQDHKMIAKQFLFTGIMWALIGAFLSVIFRMQLAYPDASFVWMEDLLGKMAPGGRISPDTYYAFTTMHGTILIFFVLTGGLSGTFSNFLIPLQVGARDMAAPFINMLSFWFFFLSSIIMLSSFFIETGAASGGWTMYPPLSALGDANMGSKLGTDLWLISMALFIVSVLLGGLNYVTTVLNMRTKGMTMTRLPLTIWAFTFTAVLGILSFPPLIGAAVLLLFDRHLGTSFFLSDIFIAGQALPYEGGSAILYQHLFWFLGHPEVYIIILPAMGIVSEVLAVQSRKPIFGYMVMVYSIFTIVTLSFLVWAHHMFVAGLNPFLGSLFVLFTLLIAIPSAIKVFNWLTTMWRGNIRLNPPGLYAIGFVSLFISGGLTGIFLGNASLDIHLHDTYFVVAHFHIVMGVAAFFAMFAGIHHWFPKMYGRYMNNTLGYIHFWITLTCAYLIFWPMHYQGLAGMPRRYYDFSTWTSFNQFGQLNVLITIVTIVVFITQFLFVFNYFYSMYKGRRVVEQNPWGANTMEWSAPIHPGHGNWVGEIPTVYRNPYEYGKDGREFIPQTEPLDKKEK